MAKNLILWVVIALVLMSVFNNFGPRRTGTEQVDYSRFIADVKQGRVQKVVIEGRNIQGVLQTGERFSTYIPETDNKALIGDLLENGVVIDARPPEQQSLLMQIFISWFPMLLLIGVWIFFMRQMQGGAGGRGALSFGKSRARLLGEDQVKVTFADVAGVDEAKEEVAELVDFLRDPAKFQKLGGKIPRGVLMVGSPGTGKTLLARAIAGEAKVPFFTISGSDFVEMFVGVGASRVRDMFEQAKKHAPCIIFIDEIDAVGRHRGAGLGGGHDEREQTLNQLLVEMDGFEGNEGIIVIAATNRPDVLDPALLRPGRFDRQVVVPLPDIRGREQILKVHMRKIPLEPRRRAERDRARNPGVLGCGSRQSRQRGCPVRSPGEPAHRRHGAVREGERQDHDGLRAALDGDERRRETPHRIPRSGPRDRRPASALPRSRLQGHDHPTRTRPGGDRCFSPRKIATATARSGSRARFRACSGGASRKSWSSALTASTTGASNDIQRATELARNMVTRWGLSEKLGPLTYSEEEGEVFLGHSVTQHKTVSDQTQDLIDDEVRSINRSELPALDRAPEGERTTASRHGQCR